MVDDGGEDAPAGRAIGDGTAALTADKQALFLETLADCGVVKIAAAAAGATSAGFYALRNRDEVFAAAWATAVERGYEALDSMLMAAAMGQPVPAGFDAQMALRLLEHRATRQARGAARSGWIAKVKRVPIADVEAEVLRRLAALKAQRSRKRPKGEA